MAEPFVTEVELAAFLSPKAPDDLNGDLLATLACEAASDLIRGACEQELGPAVTGDVALFVGNGESRDLLLPQCPVNGVGAVLVDAEGDPAYPWRLTGAGILQAPTAWPYGALIEVTYDHGYRLADTGNGVRLPAELRMLAATLAARSYQQGIARQESTGSSSVTYATASNLDMTRGEWAIVAKYVRPAAVTFAALEVAES